MPAHRDLTGKIFGQLRVMRLAQMRNGGSQWLCQCVCGNHTVVSIGNLQSKNTTSCGCVHRANVQRIGQANRTHGEAIAETVEYRTWASMKSRCVNPKDKNFTSYGGRGIVVCDRWNESFEHFLIDMGRRPSKKHSIDRVCNDGPYAPDNCRWATASEQNKNRRTFTRKGKQP